MDRSGAHDGEVSEPMIRLEALTKRYDDGTVAVDAIDLDASRGEVLVLVGPSGCGKTTTLKMINRLVEPTSGRVLLEGEDVTRGDPVQLRRRMGYVIQQVGLFPHKTVLDNTATVLTLLGQKKKPAREKAAELLELVGLDAGLHGPRYPHQLSGGQRQRVGVARALASDPPVLLMDEPFGAVDPIARTRLQNEFLRLQRELGTTVVMVTHDVEEAVHLGDRVAVLRKGGVLAQVDDPATLLGSPADDFVADFVGSDRALKRLGVTSLLDVDVEHVPVVAYDDSLADARAAMSRHDEKWAVALSDGQLHGWLARDRADGDGQVSERVQRTEAWVPGDATLKQAMSVMLQQDAGWVAVLDADDQRFLGVLTPSSLHSALRRSVGDGSTEQRSVAEL